MGLILPTRTIRGSSTFEVDSSPAAKDACQSLRNELTYIPYVRPNANSGYRCHEIAMLSYRLSLLLTAALIPTSAFTQETPSPAAGLSVYPFDIAISADGDAYVVDPNMHGVWQWKDDQLNVFFEGSAKYRTPLNAARAIAMHPDGTLLVGDSATREIYKVSEGGKAEPITGGKIGTPIDIACKSDGTIYVADLELRNLVRIPPGSGDVEVVAQVNPRGVYVDWKDRVWVVSQNPEQLLMVSDDGKTEAVVANRTFEFPHQVVVNSAGTAFVTDGYKKAIWKVVPGKAPEIFFEGPPLDNPVGISMVHDKLIVVDSRAKKVFRWNDQDKPEVWFEIKR